VRVHVFALVSFAAILPAAYAKDDAPVAPRFPPGFDCSAVAGGSQQQACYRSQLAPPTGPIPRPKQTPQVNIPPATGTPLPNTRQSTVPPLPGTIQYPLPGTIPNAK
jgi:hypothetical protein